MSADISSIRTERLYDHRSYFGNDFSIEDIQKVFVSNGVESNFTKTRAALLRASDVHIDAIGWKNIFISMNINLMPHKSMLMRRLRE